MLNTFECFMQSNGGCGSKCYCRICCVYFYVAILISQLDHYSVLPICPDCGSGSLFLNRSKYGGGRWWGCSNFKKGTCKFRKNYIEHSR